MIKKTHDGLSLNDCIMYNFLYSNEKDRVGLVIKIKEDVNFAYMITILTDRSEIDIIPYNVMEYKVL